MKSIIKNTAGLMLLTCLSLVFFTACSQKSKLKLAIELANKQCPMSMGSVGEVTSLTFDGTDVIYLLTMNEDYMNLNALKQNPESIRGVVMAMFRSPNKDVKQMLETVVAAGSGIKFIYKGKTSGEEVEYYMNPDDIKSILDDKMPQAESDRIQLEEQVNVANISCPMAVDEATTLNKLTIEPDKVVYHYTIDEQSVDMAELKQNEEQMKQSIKSSLNISEPAMSIFLKACLKCNKGLGYQYTGNASGENLEIEFSIDEIKALF